jgi:hypothetical protein
MTAVDVIAQIPRDVAEHRGGDREHDESRMCADLFEIRGLRHALRQIVQLATRVEKNLRAGACSRGRETEPPRATTDDCEPGCVHALVSITPTRAARIKRGYVIAIRSHAAAVASSSGK